VVLESVINISEGARREIVHEIAHAVVRDRLDLHIDEHHNRSVLTVVGEPAARAVAEAALHHLDITEHDGVHPRFGVVDVVPFVPLEGHTMNDALAAPLRDGKIHELSIKTKGIE
jgi:glutamate formiminotransferase / 5-formyltetrahydrofolate cyclo-ligase